MKAKARPGQISIVFSDAQLEQLRNVAQITDCSIADVVRRAVSHWLASEDQRNFVAQSVDSAETRRKLNELADKLLSEREGRKS